MEIKFDLPKDITVVPEIKKTIDKITVVELKDQPERKIVLAVTIEAGIITLWQGDAYDAIGQWTDADVTNRINELYN